MAFTKKKGIDLSGGAGLPHAGAYARILEIIHIQRTIINRYGPSSEFPGLIPIITSAIADNSSLKRTPSRKVAEGRVSMSSRSSAVPIPAFKTRS